MKIKETKERQINPKRFAGKVIKKKNVFENTTPYKKKVILSSQIVCKTPYLRVSFKGETISGSKNTELRLIRLDRKVLEPVELNTETLVTLRKDTEINKRYILYINIPPKTKVSISEISLRASSDYSIIDSYEEEFKNDVLIITPMYPSDAKPYSATFVYSKAKKYLEYGIKSDIVIASSYEKNLFKYSFGGGDVCKPSFDELRNIVQKHHYKKILVHFMDYQIGNALLACDLDGTDILIYCHGADVDLWNQDIISPYFELDHVFSQAENRIRQKRLDTLAKFEAMSNVKWIFNTKWNLNNTKKATGLEFKNHEIIPCIIDEKNFKFEKRKDSLKTNILVLKKMDNIRQYAVDLAVRIIKRLETKEYFNNLSFTIVGAGNYQHELTHPLESYKNVTIVNGFVQNDEMNDLYLKNGILLAPSRYDTQGVTASEAAMSGMVVIGSKGTGLSDMLPEELGTFFNNNNLDEAVKIIDDIYNGKKSLPKLSELTHAAIKKSASEEFIKKEIDLLKKEPKKTNRLSSIKVDDKPKKNFVLSVVIPAYNAAQYLENGVKSLINQKHADKIEIIIVNDGSKDGTVEVAKRIIEHVPKNYRDNIVLIDKENGGHGSTINKGLSVARGKYIRIMDADDRMDSQALEKHIEYLLTTDTDIVLTNTIHDLSVTSMLKRDCKYNFMAPHQTYSFDEISEEYYGFRGYGPVLSTASVKTENLRNVGCELTEKSFYVDIEYNYFMTEASKSASLDPVELYYYYLGRAGQSLARESYMKNFDQHLNVLESVIKLLERNKLTHNQYSHFVRVQLHETLFHQYRIALEMFNSYSKFRKVEKVLKKYPKYYHDDYLTPPYVKRMRKLGLPYFIVRKLKRTIRPKLGSIKRMMTGVAE